MRLKRGTLLAFAAPCLPIAAVGLPTVIYLPPYYAGELGLGLDTVGMIFLVVRLIDIPLDPVLGHLIDRTDSRFGRFRPWLAAGGALLSVGALAAFFAAPGISAVAALGGLLLLYLGYSAITVAQTAWGATLSDDYHERSRVFGWWIAVLQVGNLLVLALPPLLPRLVPGAGVAAGIHAMGWLVVAGGPLAALWCVGVLRERPPARRHAALGDFARVLANPLMRRLLLVDLLANLAPGVTGALFLFFFEAVKRYPPAQASSLLLVYFVAGLAGVPLWTALARRTSKHRALAIALLTYCVLQAATLFLPPGNWPAAAVGMALAGLPYGASLLLIRAMLADLADAETLASGSDKVGLFYAAGGAVQKLGYAIPVGILYPLLHAAGFVAARGSGNPPQALLLLTILFTAVPTVLALAAALVVRGWPLDEAAQARNAAALASSER